MSTRTTLRLRIGLALSALVAVISLGACSSDTTTTEDPGGVTSIPEPARGAADDVTDLSEDGKTVDDGNVEGTERDTEVDQAEDND